MPVRFTPDLIPRYDATFLRYINENLLKLKQALTQVAVETIGTTQPSNPYEGQEYLNTGNDVKYMYLNGIWIPVAHLGAPFTYTPTWTQTNVIANTITESSYVKEGRKVTVWLLLSATSAGVGNSIQTVTIPVTAAIAGNKAVGNGYFYDASLNQSTPFVVAMNTTTTVIFPTTELTSGVQLGLTGSGSNVAIAAADAITCCFTYLAAS